MTYLFIRCRQVLPLAVVVLAFAGSTAAQSADTASVVEVKGGTAAFEVGTNVGAISVHGKSTDLTARLKMRQTVDELSRLFEEVFRRSQSGAGQPNVLADADDEIDRLFQ